jgi:hypothetical protein
MELTEPNTDSVSNMSYVYDGIESQQRDPNWRAKFETIIAQKESDINARLIQETGKSMNWSSNLEMSFSGHSSYYPETYSTKTASLSDIIEEQKARKREHPTVQVFTQPTYKDDPELFVAKPYELVKLNCPETDLTPITMDVVPLTLAPSKNALTHLRGWRLSYIVILGPRHIRPIDLCIQFKEDGTVYSCDKKQTIGEWSIRDGDGFALWQQPSNWSMICQRAVTNHLHIKLFENKKLFEVEGDREINMIMLFDKTKNLHYLQQDSSFFQMINECLMMADTSRNPAWSAQPNIYR